MNVEGLRPAPIWVRMLSGIIRHLPAGRYILTSLTQHGARNPFLAKLPEKLGSYSFVCDLRDAISREVCFVGHYEAQETIIMRRILKPGMCFVDVGANWGYHSLIAAHLVGEEGKVISLEPDPRMFSVLRENIHRNQLEQVVVLQLAASNEASPVRLTGFEENQGNYGLSRISNSNNSDATFEAPAVSLDHLFSELNVNRVDLLKMDIEGGEKFALEGASDALTQHWIDRILLEVHPQLLKEHGQSEEEIFSFLYDLGYRPFHIDHSMEITRKAAYNLNLDVEQIVQPYRRGSTMDSWPHFLWVRPGLDQSKF